MGAILTFSPLPRGVAAVAGASRAPFTPPDRAAASTRRARRTDVAREAIYLAHPWMNNRQSAMGDWDDDDGSDRSVGSDGWGRGRDDGPSSSSSDGWGRDGDDVGGWGGDDDDDLNVARAGARGDVDATATRATTTEGAAWEVDDDSEASDLDLESDGLIAPRRGAEARRSAETTEGPAETTEADVDEDLDVDEEDSDDGWNDDDGWDAGWGDRGRSRAIEDDARERETSAPSTSRLAALPTNDPASRAPWRARLPHFVPVRELAVGAFHEGEIVHVDYAAQFGGVKSGAKARPAARSEFASRASASSVTVAAKPRWYTDDRGVKTFVDDRGVSRTGKAAYRASQKRVAAR